MESAQETAWLLFRVARRIDVHRRVDRPELRVIRPVLTIWDLPEHSCDSIADSLKIRLLHASHCQRLAVIHHAPHTPVIIELRASRECISEKIQIITHWDCPNIRAKKLLIIASDGTPCLMLRRTDGIRFAKRFFFEQQPGDQL